MPHSMHLKAESTAIDFVRELRLRQWARQNFVPPESRKATWHPVVLEEMRCRDQEIQESAMKEVASDQEQERRAPHSPHFSETADRSAFA